METIKRICRKCRPHARFAAIGFAALILANATRLILPLFSGWIVDDVGPARGVQLHPRRLVRKALAELRL